MGWSSAFISILERDRYHLGFALRSWSVEAPPAGFAFPEIDTLCTSQSTPGKPVIVDVEVSGDEMDPYDVSRSTLGEWSVIVAVEDSNGIGPIGPGSLVQLACFDLANTASEEGILLGIVYDVQRVTSALWRIRARSALSMLGSRHTAASEDLAVLGDRAATERDEVLAWTPGDTQLLVDSVTGFRSETGDDGVVKVTPAAGNTAGEEPFYLRWNGTTGTAFDLLTGLGVLGSTALVLDATLNHDVTEVLFVEDHPLQVAAKMLVSTGTGYNGPYDRLPDTWGWGIPEWAVDIDDIEYWAFQSKPPTGSDSWQIWTDAQLTNPGEWLISLLATGGWWLTMRQGRITGRALVAPADRPELADLTITDDDLIEWTEINEYDGGAQIGYQRVRATGPTGTTGTHTESLTRLPAEQRYDVDLSIYCHANEAEWVQAVVDRTGSWQLRQSERRVGRFAGLRLAQLAPGSIVLLTLGGSGRFAPYTDRPALVTRVSPGWMTGTVELVLLIQPAEGEL